MKRLVMNTIKLLLAGLLITAVALPLSAGVIYVDIDAPGGGDGTSWGTAYDDLQTALAAAAPDDSIWVAEGTYHPHVSDMSVSFLLVSGVEIYGGFSGSETLLSERDLMTNVTVLSGDIDTDGTEANNSYHVAIGSGTDSTAVLDGFTVTGGNAIGSGNDGYGGGLLNIGGSPTIRNVIFSNNSAYQGGGGISNIQGSNPMVVNAVFMENSTSYRWGGGGGIHNSQFCEPTFVNVTVFNNDAGTGYGGGMCSYDSTPRLINTIVWGNTAENSYNPQIWNNISVTEISYSIIEGCGGSGVDWYGSYGQDDGNNMDVDPLFADSDLRLKAVSPAVNSGNDSASGLPATDIDGNPRIAGLAVDMGAYEVPCPAGAIVYVDDDATGTNDGSSWANAFTDLQEALEWATCESVTEIWVAEGTYRPTSDDDRFASFHLVSGVSLYGGFAGMETSVTERDSLGSGTILSGDIGTEGYAEDNSYHVVIGSGTNSTAVLNGFMVTLGHADGGDSCNSGGGIYLSEGNPVIANVVLTDNFAYSYGGGVFNDSSSPTIRNAIFSNNSAYTAGGGISNILGSSPTVVNAVFMENSTSYGYGGGGGIHNSGLCTPTFVNVTVFNNDAGTGFGGGMFSWDSTPRLINTIMWGNSAENSTNPQIWNNTSVTEISFSLIEGCGGSGTGWDGTYGVDYGGNIDIDPMFFDEAGGDLRLIPESNAVNAGAVDSIPAGIVTDLGGNPRIVNTDVDIGAYESQATCPPDSVLYVDASATGENVGTSWTDAFIKLQDALEWAQVCPLVTQIWVAAGTYSPGIDSIVTDRTETFELLDGIVVYGGFTGMETDLYERDWVANLTVLSGDIGAPGDNTDNSYHVITASGTDATAVLDGFTITGGNANASVTAPAPALSSIFDPEQIAKDVKPTSSGAFVTGSRLVASWIDTHGGGITNIGGSPTLRNLVVSDNYAADGGGMYNDSGSPTLLNVRFLDNTGIWGGAVHNWDAGAPIFINVLFDGNAADFGAALYNNWSDPDLVNVTVYGNSAYRGGGMYNNYSDPVIVNSILWADSAQDAGDEIYNYDASGSPDISYSLVEGCGGSGAWDPSFGTDGGGNIDTDPMFMDESAGDFSMSPGSPAVDSGDNGVAGLAATDLDGNARVVNGTVDMGVYEFQGPPCPPDPVLYVDAAATGAETGTSWADAFTNLGNALLYATCPGITDIWVAAGTYYPTAGTDRTATFQLVDGIWIYGGFVGSETYRYERDWTTNVTVLSGDIGIAEDDSDNSYHVVTGSGTNSTAMLDGFTVTLGNADGPGDANRGGGMLTVGGSPTIRNTIFIDNSAEFGGGMHNYNGSDPTLVDVTFTYNSADHGAGMRNDGSSDAALYNVVFSGNTAASHGGGMHNDHGSDPTLINVIFHGNAATVEGGGMFNGVGSSPMLVNVTFSENSAGTGGGMLNWSGSDPTLVNAIFWGNLAVTGNEIYNISSTPLISWSLIEGSGGSGGGWDAGLGTDGFNNLDADPMFIDAVLGDLRLFPGSPAVDVGDNGSIPSGISFDLGGNPRIIDGTVDMGAYELQGTCPPDSVLYVDADATGLNDGKSWTDAFTELRYALGWASYCPGVTQIWVVQGTYCPTAGTDRSATFQLANSLEIYGGFTGGESEVSERDWTANGTFLSGDIGDQFNSTDNSYHIVTGSATDATAVLDGFTVTDGNADGAGAYAHGGGQYNDSGSPTVVNVIFLNNHAGDHGGGMYNSGSFPAVVNVIFSDNVADDRGGAMFNEMGSNPAITNTVFVNNMITGDLGGGGIYNSDSNPTLVNVTIVNNSAGPGWGGGIFNLNSLSILVNTIVCGNIAGSGDNPQIYNNNSSTEIYFSLLEGCNGSGPGWDASFGMDFGSNLDADPMFLAAPFDLRLTAGSPAINAGDNASVPPGVITDLDGNSRIAEGTVDIGAYEYQQALASAFPSPIVFEDVPMNQATCDTVYYTNYGGTTCTIAGIYGCTTAPFSIDTTMTDHTLAPGGTTSVVVCVYPTAAEPDTVQLVIVSDAFNSPTVVEVRLNTATSTDVHDRIPQPFRIVSVSPNPFNPSTTLHFTLPAEMPVTAVIYSVTGARVRVLANGERFGPGENRLTWNGRTDRGSPAASGVYFIRLKTRLGTEVTRAVLLK